MTEATAARTLTIAFKEKDVSLAVLAMLIEAFGLRWLFVGVAVVGVAILVGSAMQVTALNALGAWTGLAVAVAAAFILFAALYVLNLRFAVRAFRGLAKREVIYEFSQEGCTVRCGDSKLVLSWKSIAKVLRYPAVWLLEIRTDRSPAQVAGDFKASMREKGSVALAQNEFPSFPVVWPQPIPVRSFLYLPKQHLDSSLRAFVLRNVQDRDR